MKYAQRISICIYDFLNSLMIQLNPRITRITLTIAQSAICLRSIFNNPIDVVYNSRSSAED